MIEANRLMPFVLLYRSNLSYGVKTHPWHVRDNGLSKPLEKLQLLLLTQHQFATGHTLKLENEFRFGAPSSCSLILAAIRSKPVVIFSLSRLENQRLVPLLDLRLYGDGAVGQAQLRYASNNVLLILHVARGSETERERDSVTQPVTILGRGHPLVDTPSILQWLVYRRSR